MATALTPGLPTQRRPSILRPLLYLIGVAAPATVITTLALTTAGPIVRLNRDSYDTSHAFVNGNWWVVAFGLIIPLFFFGRAHPRWVALGVLAAVVPQFLVAHIYVTRVGQSGWGDGLEYFVYLEAAFMAFVFIASAAIGVATRRLHPWRSAS